VQFDALWISTSKPSSTPKTTKASTSNVDALCAQSQHPNVEQVLVESCDEAIGKKMIT
jgi:hypothetical protein